MIASTGTGEAAPSDLALLDGVRTNNLIAFRQAWKRFEEVVPGSLQLVTQPEPCVAIERNYGAIRDMILGEAPDLGWNVDWLRRAESVVNRG